MLPSQLALPAPEVTSPERPAAGTAAVSPSPAVQIATAQQQPAVALSQLAQIHSHSLPPPASAIPTPYHQNQIQLGSPLVQSSSQAAVSVLAYDTASGTLFDPRSGLATKIKGGLSLASLGKMSNKYSPY